MCLACPVSAVMGSSVLWRRRLLALRPWELGLAGLLVSDHIPSGYSLPAWWLDGLEGQGGMGKAMERGRDREGLSSWSLAGAWCAQQAGEGQQVPGAGQEVGTGAGLGMGSVRSVSMRSLCLCQACLSLKRWYVFSVGEEAKSSQRRKGLCQEQEEDWANGRGESGPGTGPEWRIRCLKQRRAGHRE